MVLLKHSCRFLLLFSSLIILGLHPAQAVSASIQSGPFLHIYEDHLLVTLQGRDLEGAEVEWKFGKKTGKIPLQRGKRRTWLAPLHGIGDRSGYFYRIVQDVPLIEWIPIHTLVPKSKRFSFAVYGDNREGWGDSLIHRNLLKQMKKDHPDLILHTGDLVAQGGYEKYWQDCFKLVQPLGGSIAFQPAIGNHDLSKKNLFADFFPLGKERKNYYSFNYGGALFIALDTTIDYARKSPQYKFLEKTLQRADEDLPIFVYFHQPPFSSSKHGSDKRIQKFLVPLFERYGVDIVFSGHDHTYQRIGPINGVLYIVTAGGGSNLYQVQPNPALQSFKVLYHYVLIKVEGNQVRGWVKNTMGVVEDKFSINHAANPVLVHHREVLPEM